MKKLIIILLLFVSCQDYHETTIYKHIDLEGVYLLGTDTVRFTKTLCIYVDTVHYSASKEIVVFEEIVFFRNLWVRYEETDTSLVLTDILNTENLVLIKH